MAINPLTLFFTSTSTPATNGSGGATYTNVSIPTSLNGTPLSQDQRILTYALAAELLEYTLYQQAYLYLTGQPLPSATGTTAVADALGYVYGTGTIPGGTVSGVNLGASTSSAIAIYLAEFAAIENLHGQFLISALGGNPYTQAAGSSIQFAFGLHTLTTPVAVAQAIYGAELTGVSAYLGAIPGFTQQSPYLQTAASIQGTEARHTTALAATINAANGNGNIETAPMYNEGFKSHGLDVPLFQDQILNGAGATSGTTVPGGTITPISGPYGTAVGAANGTTTPTYNGFVYLVTTP